MGHLPINDFQVPARSRLSDRHPCAAFGMKVLRGTIKHFENFTLGNAMIVNVWLASVLVIGESDSHFRSHLAENQGGILTAKGIDSGDGNINSRIPRFRRDVQLDRINRLARVDRSGNFVLVKREDGRGGVDAAAGG